MFDRIAGRYDLANRLLSLRRDVAWRRRVARHLPAGEGLRVLDLATGTGDLLLALAASASRVCVQKRGGTPLLPCRVGLSVGLDMSPKMLEIAREKMGRSGGTGSERSLECRPQWFRLVRADVTAIPFADSSMDVATMGFGIRNVADVGRSIGEARRVLRPGGRLLVLEFSLPTNPLVRAVYRLYLRHVLPRLGGWLTGEGDAYRYLADTVEEFPDGAAFCEQMRNVGFSGVRAYPLTFGIATLYEGDR